MNVNYFKPLWRNTLVMLLFCFGLTSLWGQTEIMNNQLRSTAAINLWNPVFVNYESATGGYARFTTSNSSLTTPVFNASTYAFIDVQMSVAKYGSGTDGPITVLYSLDGGTSWETGGNSLTPSSSSYLTNTVTINETSSNMVIRFTRTNSPSEKRFRDVIISGVEAVSTTYGITYDGNFQDIGVAPVDNNEYEENDEVTVLGQGTLEKIGYHFTGWNTLANGSGTSYAESATFSMPANDVTLYAQWAINTYTVTYDGNGSDGGTAPIDENTHNHGSDVTVLGHGDLTLTDHSFLSWNTQADGLGTAYLTGSIISNITSDITLYAQWLDDSLEPQTITFEPLANVTYGDAAFNLTATSDSGLAVSYASSNENVATIDGNTLTIVGVGTTDITASQLGDEINYQPAVPVVQTLTVNQKNLTISGVTVEDKPYDGTTNATIVASDATLNGVVGTDDVDFATGTGEFVSADAGSDIAVTLTSDFTLSGTAAGNYTLTQPVLTGNITKADQTLSGFENLTKHENDEAFDLPATTAEGLTLTYESLNTAVATVSGNTVTIAGIGTTTITATQAGDDNYNDFEGAILLTVMNQPIALAQWDFTGESDVSTSTAEIVHTSLDVGSGVLTRGSGASSSSGNNSFRTTGFQNNGISTSNTDYFQTTFSSTEGIISFATIDASFVGTSSFTTAPGVTTQFAYSFDNVTYTLIPASLKVTIGNNNMEQVDLSGVSALQNIPAGTTIYFRFYASGQTTTGGFGFSGSNGLQFHGNINVPIVPTLSTNISSIENLNYGEGNGPSASQSFVLSGENLDGSDVTVTAPANFEVSETETSGYAGSVALTAYDGTDKTVWVRLSVGQLINTYNGSVTISGGGATDAIVAVSGAVLAVPVVTAETFNGTVGVAFSEQIEATETPSSYAYTGTLPNGLDLNTTTGAITGTPEMVDSFEIEVTATNAAGTSVATTITFEIAKGTQTVENFNDVIVNIDEITYQLPELTSAGIVINYSSSVESIATVSGNTVTLVALGETVISASAIDNDGNWLDFSDSIELTVNEGPCYEQDFEQQASSISNWTTGGGTTNVNGNTSNYYLNLNENGEFAIPPIENIGLLTFKVAGSSNSSNSWTLHIQTKEYGTDWITHTTFAGSETNQTYTTKSVLFPQGVTFVRFYLERTGNSCYIDDVSITCASSVNAIWENETWSQLPTEELNTVIKDELEVDGINQNGFSANNLVVITGGNLTVKGGNTVTVNGKIINESTTNAFIVESNAILMQNDGEAVNTGAITVLRDANPMKRLDYTLWSSPVSGMLLNEFSDISDNGGTGTIYSRVYELGATAWTSIWGTYAEASTSTDTFDAAKGYLYRAFNSYDAVTQTTFTGEFTGVPHNGNYSIDTPNAFDAIGNPYPSPIEANDFIIGNTGVSAVYFWTNVNSSNGTAYTHNNWASYTTVGGVGVAIGGDSENIDPESIPADNMHIQPGQGFVVYTEETTSSVTFNNAMRVADANGAFFKQMSNEKHRFWLNLSNEEVVFNQILVGYIEDATQGIDTGIDAKMFAYEGNALYSIIENSDENYVIQGRSLPFEASDVVALGFRAVNAGSFTISLDNFDGLFAEGNTTIYLKDNYTQTQHNLMSGAYSFISDEGMFDNRFEVVYQTTMNVENPVANNSNWVVYNQGEGYQIQTQGFELQNVTVFDLLGRTIYTANAQGTAHNIPSLGAESVYIVKVTSTENVVLSKKVK